MMKFYVKGKFIYSYKERDETWSMFQERMIFLLPRATKPNIEQYSFIYINKLFFGVSYDSQIEENLEIIENVKISPTPYKKLNIKEWPVKDLGIEKHIRGQSLIITERDLNVNASIIRILKGNRSLYVEEFPTGTYDVIILYCSFAFIERYSSFFAKVRELLSPDGDLILIDDLILLDYDKQYYVDVARTLRPEFTHPRFQKQNVMNGTITTENFDLYDQSMDISTYSVMSHFKKSSYLPKNMINTMPKAYETLNLEHPDIPQDKNIFFTHAVEKNLISLKKISIAHPDKKFYFI